MREHTPTQSDDLYDLVSDRAIAAKPLILTSNRAPKDWYPLFPNPVVAESLLDRLINTSHQSSWTARPTGPGNDPAPNQLTATDSFATLTTAAPGHGELRDGYPWGITRPPTGAATTGAGLEAGDGPVLRRQVAELRVRQTARLSGPQYS